MRQLTFIRRGRLEWWDVADPTLQAPSDAIVRPFAVARCDLDNAFLSMDIATRLKWGTRLRIVDPRVRRDFGRNAFEGPFPYGHECVAEVVEIGGDVKNCKRGDVVIVPFQISCGRCLTCQRGITSHCEVERTERPIAAYGFTDHIGGAWGGALSDYVRVPHADHMLVHVPPGVDPVSLASASDNIPDGWRGVGPQLKRFPGAPVLILGGRARSVGLYAAGIAVALGSERVDYVDTNQARLAIAGRLGANPIRRKPGKSAFRALSGLHPGGYPIVFDADGTDDALSFALQSLSPGGMCTAASFNFQKGIQLPIWEMMVKSLSFETGFARPSVSLPDILALVASGKFDPGLVTTQLADWEEAPIALKSRRAARPGVRLGAPRNKFLLPQRPWPWPDADETVASAASGSPVRPTSAMRRPTVSEMGWGELCGCFGNVSLSGPPGEDGPTLSIGRLVSLLRRFVQQVVDEHGHQHRLAADAGLRIDLAELRADRAGGRAAQAGVLGDVAAFQREQSHFALARRQSPFLEAQRDMIGECAARAGERLLFPAQLPRQTDDIARTEDDARQQRDGDDAFHGEVQAEALTCLFELVLDAIEHEKRGRDDLQDHDYHGERHPPIQQRSHGARVA